MTYRSHRFAAAAGHAHSDGLRRDIVVKMLFVGLATLSLAFTFSSVASGQGQTVSVGVSEFQDDSGAELPEGGAQKLGRELAQKLNSNYKDVLARRLEASAEPSAVKALTVEQLVALGKQYGVKFVVRGGLLAATARASTGENGASVQLYADIVSVETMSVRTERAEGNGAGKEHALSNAIAQLAELIHRAVISPDSKDVAQTVEDVAQTVRDVAQTVESAPVLSKDVAQTVESAPVLSKDVAQTVESAPDENVAADADQELQQLIAEAESLVADGTTGNADRLASVSQALAALKSALKSKAALLEEGKDPATADQEVAQHSEELQASLTALAESQMPGATDPIDTPEELQPSGEKKNLLARIGEYVSETLNIIQKIQEMRAALRGAGDGQQPAFTEESTEEITGVVTEMGEPVAGVTVTEPESGVNAETDINGSYALPGVAAGRLATLVLAKRGNQIATGKINLARRGSAVADFELKPKAAGTARSILRILPSKVRVARPNTNAGNTGVLTGVVRDARGRPAARALVRIKGLAMARTDSQGRYVFLNILPGRYQLLVQGTGLKPRTAMVEVAAKKSSESKVQFVAADRIQNVRRPSLVVRGTGTLLRGVVIDTQKRPLPGAKITVIHGTTTVSVLAAPRGSYLIRDLKPGSYRVLVSRAGHNTISLSVTLRQGEIAQRDFQMSKVDSPFIARRGGGFALAAKKANDNVKATAPAGGETRKGQLKGRIVDARTGRPLPGAVILISGQRAVTSDRTGSYALDDILPGAYRLIARKAEFMDGTARLVVRPGETTTANLRLSPKPLSRVR